MLPQNDMTDRDYKKNSCNITLHNGETVMHCSISRCQIIPSSDGGGAGVGGVERMQGHTFVVLCEGLSTSPHDT